jgi:hypothetical protein
MLLRERFIPILDRTGSSATEKRSGETDRSQRGDTQRHAPRHAGIARGKGKGKDREERSRREQGE